MAPIADTSAIVDPEIPEKKYSASTTDIPRPPRTDPTSARARSTSAYDIPQRSMRLPAKTNVGMASSTQLWEPATRLDGSFWSENPPATNPAKPAIPSEKTIGSETAVRTRNVTTTTLTSMASGRCLRSLHRAHGVDEAVRAVDHDEDPTDDRGEIEPAQIEIESG